MDQLRNQVPLTGAEQPFRQEIAIPGCTGPADAPVLCPLDRFEALVAAKLTAGDVDAETANAGGYGAAVAGRRQLEDVGPAQRVSRDGKGWGKGKGGSVRGDLGGGRSM